MLDFVWVVLAIAVVGAGLYFLATTLFGPGEPVQPSGEATAWPLPEDRALSAQDLRATRFAVTARGYRMSEVDELIDRLTAQLDRQEDALRELHHPADEAAELPAPQDEAPATELETDRQAPDSDRT